MHSRRLWQQLYNILSDRHQHEFTRRDLQRAVDLHCNVDLHRSDLDRGQQLVLGLASRL